MGEFFGGVANKGLSGRLSKMLETGGAIPYYFGKCPQVHEKKGDTGEIPRPVCAKCAQVIGGTGVTSEVGNDTCGREMDWSNLRREKSEMGANFQNRRIARKLLNIKYHFFGTLRRTGSVVEKSAEEGLWAMEFS